MIIIVIVTVLTLVLYRKLFVGGLSRMVTESKLVEAFSRFGTVVYASIMRDQVTRLVCFHTAQIDNLAHATSL